MHPALALFAIINTPPPFYNDIKSKVGLVLAKAAALPITLNLDGAPIPSRAYTHTTHSTNSRLISTALYHYISLPQARST